MKQSIIAGISALLLAVFLPMALLSPVDAAQPEEATLVWTQDGAAAAEPEPEPEPEAVQEPEAAANPGWDAAETVALETEDGVVTLPLSEYLTGVVLSEMPASFSEAALEAQTVAARTFTLKQRAAGKHPGADLCADSSCCQAWTGREALETKLGDGFAAYWDKASQAVSATDGLVLTYGGDLIDAVYFSCSGGTTEDAVAVWGGDVPYLQTVESPGEEISGKFETTVTVPLAEFRQILQTADPQVWLAGSPSGWFGDRVETDGGGVDTLEIGGRIFRGTELRTLFGLNSAKFTVEATAEAVVFTVSGYGHRVGMSQYGAEAMARAGADFEEILLHYYTGVTLEFLGAD